MIFVQLNCAGEKLICMVYERLVLFGNVLTDNDSLKEASHIHIHMYKGIALGNPALRTIDTSAERATYTTSMKKFVYS